MSPCRASSTACSISGVTSTTVYGIRLDVAILTAIAPFWPGLWPQRTMTVGHEVGVDTSFTPSRAEHEVRPTQDGGVYRSAPGQLPRLTGWRAGGLQPARDGC